VNEEVKKLVNLLEYQQLTDYECIKELRVDYQETSRHKVKEKVFRVGVIVKVNPNYALCSNDDESVYINDGRCKFWFGISKDKFEECFELREQLSLF